MTDSTVEFCAVQFRTRQLCALQVATREVAATEIAITEVRLAQDGVREVASCEVRALEVDLGCRDHAHVRLVHDATDEACTGQVPATDRRLLDRAPTEVRATAADQITELLRAEFLFVDRVGGYGAGRSCTGRRVLRRGGQVSGTDLSLGNP